MSWKLQLLLLSFVQQLQQKDESKSFFTSGNIHPFGLEELLWNDLYYLMMMQSVKFGNS
jgi:hypothetical protein